MLAREGEGKFAFPLLRWGRREMHISVANGLTLCGARRSFSVGNGFDSMMTLDEIVKSKAVDAADHDLENWVGKALAGNIQLSSKFAPTVRGRARLFSFENVLELAFLAAFVRSGFKVSEAAAFAASNARAAKGGGFREWTIFGSDLGKAAGSSELTTEQLVSVAKRDRACIVRVICMGEIKRRVEALFAEDK